MKISLPATVVSTLPPEAAARSIVTPPEGMASTWCFLMRIGAFLPGIRAVVIITSMCLHSSNSILSAASNHSVVQETKRVICIKINVDIKI